MTDSSHLNAQSLRAELAEANRLLTLSRAKARLLADKITNRDSAYELLLEACRDRIKEWRRSAESASVEGGEEYAFRTCSEELAESLREAGEKQE